MTEIEYTTISKVWSFIGRSLEPCINFEGVFNDLKCLVVLFKVRRTAGCVLLESLGTPFGRLSEIAAADVVVNVRQGR